MATVRIYLCTYRRNSLLPRALQGLQAQTFTDWVCEVHNDDPQDSFPQQYVESLGDRRITVVNHESNWGAMRVFNHVFRPVEEQFVSLLEDDNWWEPEFLQTLIQTLEQNPQVNVAWANMRFCQEDEEGNWSTLDETIWPIPEDIDPVSPQLFHFPDRRQMFGALHSQGAMLVRAPRCGSYQVPATTTSAAGEHVRERVFDYPIAFLPQVLGNYALTRDTSRSSRQSTWNTIQVLLGGSFIRQVPLQANTIEAIWADARSRRISSVNILFWIALYYPGCRWLLKQAKIQDWWVFLRHSLIRFSQFLETYQLLQQQKELRQFLDEQTATRVQVAQQEGFLAL